MPRPRSLGVGHVLGHMVVLLRESLPPEDGEAVPRDVVEVGHGFNSWSHRRRCAVLGSSQHFCPTQAPPLPTMLRYFPRVFEQLKLEREISKPYLFVRILKFAKN